MYEQPEEEEVNEGDLLVPNPLLSGSPTTGPWLDPVSQWLRSPPPCSPGADHTERRELPAPAVVEESSVPDPLLSRSPTTSPWLDRLFQSMRSPPHCSLGVDHMGMGLLEYEFDFEYEPPPNSLVLSPPQGRNFGTTVIPIEGGCDLDSGVGAYHDDFLNLNCFSTENLSYNGCTRIFSSPLALPSSSSRDYSDPCNLSPNANSNFSRIDDFLSLNGTGTEKLLDTEFSKKLFGTIISRIINIMIQQNWNIFFTSDGHRTCYFSPCFAPVANTNSDFLRTRALHDIIVFKSGCNSKSTRFRSPKDKLVHLFPLVIEFGTIEFAKYMQVRSEVSCEVAEFYIIEAMTSKHPREYIESYERIRGWSVANASRSLTAVPIADTQKKGEVSSKKRGRIEKPISLDNLQQHFDKPRKEAAQSLNISVPTLKRICRKYEIPRWPYCKKNERSPFALKDVNISVTCSEGELSQTSLSTRALLGACGSSLAPSNLKGCNQHNLELAFQQTELNQSNVVNLVDASDLVQVETPMENIPKFSGIGSSCSNPSSEHLATDTGVQTSLSPPETAMQDMRSVTVKATYEDKHEKKVIITFDLFTSSKMVDLKKEVVERLSLKVQSFNVEYQDEEGDWILIGCDDDLRRCILRSLGKTTIRMKVNRL